MSAPEVISPIAHRFTPGRFGAAGGKVVELSLPRRAIWQLMSAKGARDAVNATVRSSLGLALPGPNQATGSDALTILAIQPDHWLIAATIAQGEALRAKIQAIASDEAALVEQSGGKAILRISGAHAR